VVEFAIILYMINNRTVYTKYFSFVNLSFIKNNYKDIYKLFVAIDNHYTHHPESNSITISELEAKTLSMYPMMKDSERVLLSSLLVKVSSSSTDETTILGYLKEHRNRAIAGELAITALEVSEGRKSLDALDSVYEKFELSHEQEEQNFYVTDNLEELIDSVSGASGLRWRLPWMNQALGSLRQGDFGFFFARPETGKTTWLASEVTYFAEQTDRPILWCNNEEGGNKVKVRCYQASLGITYDELRANFQHNREEYLRRTGDRIKIYDDAGMTRRDIEARCKELQPSLIILDQIDKIKGFSDDRYDLQMKAIYQWARELAKRYGAVIGICQAGSTAEGKKWLQMNDVDSSHTAKQGEADFIVGIGKSHEEGMGDIRFLNISKNKLIGDSDSIPGLRHGKCETIIKADIARYESV